jgi:hypothetical protein
VHGSAAVIARPPGAAVTVRAGQADDRVHDFADERMVPRGVARDHLLVSKRSRSGWLFDGVLWSAAAVTPYTAVLLGLLLSTKRPVPTAAVAIEMVIALPIFLFAIMFRRRYWHAGGSSVVTPTLARARAIVVGAVGVLLAMIVTALVLIVDLPDETAPLGQPEVVNGQYVLNEHGLVTPVPRLDGRSTAVRPRSCHDHGRHGRTNRRPWPATLELHRTGRQGRSRRSAGTRIGRAPPA